MARTERFADKTKGKAVRESNIEAAKAVADAVRTSLGPRGMDKMVSLVDVDKHTDRPGVPMDVWSLALLITSAPFVRLLGGCRWWGSDYYQ